LAVSSTIRDSTTKALEKGTTVSAIPLSDGSFTTINPSKMEDDSESTTAKPNMKSTKHSSTQVTDSYGVTYVPVVTYASARSLSNDKRSDDSDTPDQMVEMVPPFGGENKTFVDPRLGKKMSRASRKLVLTPKPKNILFTPNIRTLKIAADAKKRVKKSASPNQRVLVDRMYNFTEFEDEKSKQQGMPKATPHVTSSLFETLRDDRNSNETVDKDLEILFENLDPEPDESNRGYIVHNSKLVVKTRVKRGAEGSQASDNTFNYDKYCGGTFRGLSGVIKSPNYPLYYPNRKHCVYDIEVPDGHDYTIKFTCDDFGVQGNKESNCSHDYLEIWPNGMDSNNSSIERFCGNYDNENPLVVSSEGNKMLVKFDSDRLFRYKGFQCRYRAMQSNGISVINSFVDETSEHRVHIYDSNFFKSLYHCEGERRQEISSNEPNALVDATFQSGGGLWSGSCGSSNELDSLLSDRIVGGVETIKHQYPWMVSILKKCEGENGEETFCHICGGTLISKAWVLSGAHCMVDVPKADMLVLLGSHSLNDNDNEVRYVEVSKKVVHPDYNQPTVLNNDIGLVKMKVDLNAFTKFVSPLCLPSIGDTGFGTSAYGNGSESVLDTSGLDIVGRSATVLGWGVINDAGTYPDGLQEVTVEILNNTDCSQLYGPIITENMMCTSGKNAKGSCFGDSGGPAIVKNDAGFYVQVGIVSFGGGICEEGYPSGQVLVHKFSDWIEAVTGLTF